MADEALNTPIGFGTSSLASVEINGLSDVVISSVSSGEVLKYNGTNWVNDTDSGGAFTEDGSQNIYAGSGAGAALDTGIGNFLVSRLAGNNITSGLYNIAIGDSAGNSVTTGDNGIFIGQGADTLSATIDNGIAIGAYSATSAGVAIGYNTDAPGNGNVAIGNEACSGTTGTACVGIGYRTVRNRSGMGNVGVGSAVMSATGAGMNNTAIGNNALNAVTSGNGNIAVGNSAAVTLTTGSSNIYIGGGSTASAVDVSNEIVIGASATGQGTNTCVINEIRGVTTNTADAVNVLISSDGQLGTVSSSERYKKDIRALEFETSSILALEPVNFTYKQNNAPDFGLIAEQVNQHIPELVVKDKEGAIETVFYRKLSTLLLKVCREQQQEINDLKTSVTSLIDRVTALEA